MVAARLLWTFSAAYRAYQDPADWQAARHAYAYLTGPLWDETYAGVYWTVLPQGGPANDRKHVYAQAFAIYALSEYALAGGEPQALQTAQTLFEQIETHSSDPTHGGNIECLSRTWGPLEDMRLSDKELPSRKSMNTLLHLMEAYTNLLRAWPAPELRHKQAGLVRIFLDHILDPHTGHFRLFFDDAWNSLLPVISYGHDIEGAWLVEEAAQQQGDAPLLARAQAAALQMAAAVYREGRDTDGSLFYEGGPRTAHSMQKHWWPQAEGMVGFYNAYQLSGLPEFEQAARQCWDEIQAHFVDRVHGDWFKVLQRDGTPLPNQPKVGPWECPYHHARACLEMLHRLPAP